jgi:hypothetical protein
VSAAALLVALATSGFTATAPQLSLVPARPPGQNAKLPTPRPAALDPAILRRAIRRWLTGVAACHKLHGPGTSFSFVIAADGTVSVPPTGNAPLDGCLAQAMKGMRLPPPANPVVITYPFLFDGPSD